MISTLFTLQIILLAVGLFVGYWFLITASKQEQRLRTIGEILGWVVIVGTIFLLICNLFLSIMIINRYNNDAYYLLRTQEQEKPSVDEETQGDQSDTLLVPDREQDNTIRTNSGRSD